MNIIYISPWNQENPRLFPALKPYFESNGHFEAYNSNDVSHIFMEVQSGDTGYDQNDLSLISDKRPILIIWDSREFGTMRNEKWSPIELNPSIYFVRNMNKEEEYPNNVYPFDWPYFEGHNFEPVSKEELFSRPYDCCFFGTESPARKIAIDEILKDGRLKLNYEFRDHTKRVSYDQWINEHRSSKLYISCEGGGMTNERPLQLFSISPMLNIRNNHLAANPFEDGVNCLEIGAIPTSEDIEKVVDILQDKDWLYDIYLNGISHTENNYSAESVSLYILDKIGMKK